MILVLWSLTLAATLSATSTRTRMIAVHGIVSHRPTVLTEHLTIHPVRVFKRSFRLTFVRSRSWRRLRRSSVETPKVARAAVLDKALECILQTFLKMQCVRLSRNCEFIQMHFPLPILCCYLLYSQRSCGDKIKAIIFSAPSLFTISQDLTYSGFFEYDFMRSILCGKIFRATSS